MKNELLKLLNKPCWFKDGILEIRNNSDAYLKEVENEYIVIKNSIFEKENKIPINQISSINRKDLETIKKLNYSDDLYEEKLLEVVSFLKKNNYSFALVKATTLQKLLEPDDYLSNLWVSGPIVASQINMIKSGEYDVEPGSEMYEEIKGQLKRLLFSYNNVSNEIKEQYRNSDIYFDQYNILESKLNSNLPLSTSKTFPAKQKSGCLGIILLTILLSSYLIFI